MTTFHAQTPDQQRAGKAVAYALRNGTLVRPDHCEHCGGDNANGRALSAHHHNGYEPGHELDVIFLCDSCHSKEHSAVIGARGRLRVQMERFTPEQRTVWRRKGGLVANAKLTPEERSAAGLKGAINANAKRTPEQRAAYGRKGACIARHGRDCDCWKERG